MIEPIPGWGWEMREAGIFLIPPGGERAGSIRYVERVRPLRRIVDVLAALPVPASYVHETTSPPEPLITGEGEYAALVIARGALDGAPIERVIGCVFVDDFYSLIGGVAWQPDHVDLIRERVRQLVLSDRHLLGVRRRRFLYRKPPGWHGLLVPPYHAYWFPPDTRKNGGMLSIFPAVPEPPELVAARLLVSAGAPTDYDLAAGTALTARGGLSGFMHETSDGKSSIMAVVLQDGRYAYPLLLQTPPLRQAQHRLLLLAVVGSVEPIPSPGAEQRSGAATALTMWDE